MHFRYYAFFITLSIFFSYETVAQVYVNTPSGVIVGRKVGDIHVFKGIPYAKPPVNELRWAPPEELENMDSIFAMDWAPVCPQKLTQQGNPNAFTIEGEEDCLTLNIWAPTNIKKPAPVMVFIHGGGNQQGSASVEVYGARIYDGQLMVERGGVVLVTVQYRLGPLGFLVHPALEQAHPKGKSGNYGLLDQLLALKWIKEHIGYFGGDKDNITVFGESAGSIDIGCHLLSPHANGLFEKAVMQSGTPFIKSYSKAKNAGIAYIDSLGCDRATPEKTLECMKSLSYRKLLELEQSPLDNNGAGGYIGPVADGWYLPVDADHPFSHGVSNNVPVIIGSNSNEMGIAIPQTVTPKDVRDFFEAIAPPELVTEGLSLYPPGNNNITARKALVDATTDAFFTAPARRTARAIQRSQDQQVWRYVFDRKLNGLGGLFGAFHSLELFYVFNTLEYSDYASAGMDDKDRYVYRKMLQYWTHFAYTGDPNPENANEWPPYDADSDPYLRIKSPVTDEALYREKKCNYWDSLYQHLTTTTPPSEVKKDAGLSIFPNPARDKISIRFYASNTGQGQVVIANLDAGERIVSDIRWNPGINTISIDVSSLPASIYRVFLRGKHAPLRSALLIITIPSSNR